MERETGIEPAAPTLARSCSTTELFPRSLFKKTIVIVSKLNNKSQGFVQISNSLLQNRLWLCPLLVAMSVYKNAQRHFLISHNKRACKRVVALIFNDNKPKIQIKPV